MHFDEGLSARVKGGDSTKLVTVRGKRAAEKLSEEGLVKFSARVSIQVSHLQGDRFFVCCDLEAAPERCKVP